MDPSTNGTPNRQLQGLDIYQPGTPFLVLSPSQIFDQRLPVWHSSSRSQTNQYQSLTTEVQGASSQSQRVVQVPGVMTSGVSNSAFLSGPSAMPAKPPEQPLIIQNILASGSGKHACYFTEKISL